MIASDFPQLSGGQQYPKTIEEANLKMALTIPWWAKPLIMEIPLQVQYSRVCFGFRMAAVHLDQELKQKEQEATIQDGQDAEPEPGSEPEPGPEPEPPRLRLTTAEIHIATGPSLAAWILFWILLFTSVVFGIPPPWVLTLVVALFIAYWLVKSPDPDDVEQAKKTFATC